ncbi:MAG TPA: hypothetical protein VIL49_05395, partial [Capillimicrobium sp.]
GAGGPGLFKSVEILENIEISMYLAAITANARSQNAKAARVLAEAMGTEAEHRALARFAQNALGAPVGVPDDRSFQLYGVKRADRAQAALEKVGVGFGVEGAQPGAFYEFPGDPVKAGVGAAISSRVPR